MLFVQSMQFVSIFGSKVRLVSSWLETFPTVSLLTKQAASAPRSACIAGRRSVSVGLRCHVPLVCETCSFLKDAEDAN